LFGARAAELLGVAGLFEQPFGAVEVAERLFPLVFEAGELAAEAVAVGELVGVLERFQESERAPGVGERRLRRALLPGRLGEGAVVVDAQARGGELSASAAACSTSVRARCVSPLVWRASASWVR
jgi:hypothetical protein